MSRTLNIIAAMLLCLTAVSCLSDSSNAELSRDCYISSVTLGTMRRTIHVQRWSDTLQAYWDSTYTTTYSGSYYRMAIDQIRGTISNPDSLLLNTVMEKALLTVSASGTVIYRPTDQLEEEWTAYSSTDSVPISAPLLMRVYSTDGSAMREYRVTFNVHRQDPDGFSWERRTLADYESLNLEQHPELPAPYQYVASYDTLTYAIADGRMWHAGSSMQWEEDGCDTPDMLPTMGVVGIAYDMPYGGARIMMIGCRAGDDLSTVWGKTCIEGQKTQWIHYPWTAENHDPLPALTDMSLTRYNGELVAIGGKLEAAYISVDNGVTWKPNYTWTLPTLNPSYPATITADGNGGLWIVNGETVYYGRANSIGDTRLTGR